MAAKWAVDLVGNWKLE